MHREFTRARRLASLAALASLPICTLSEAVPTSIPYTGLLTFDTGAPYEPPGGVVDVSARLYTSPTGGDLVWGPLTLPNQPVTQGILSFVLDGDLLLGTLEGAPVPLDDVLAASSGALWLELSINAEPMLPRQRLHSVPFARIAADTKAVGGVPAEEIATLADLAEGGGGSAGPVRRSYVQVAGLQSFPTPTPFSFAATAPTWSQGALAMNLTHTPSQAGNSLFVRARVYVGEATNHSDIMVAALFSDAALLATGLSHDHYSYFPGNLNLSHISMTRQVVASSQSPITFSVRIGSFGSGPISLNGTNQNLFGGSLVSSLEVLEYVP